MKFIDFNLEKGVDYNSNNTTLRARAHINILGKTKREWEDIVLFEYRRIFQLVKSHDLDQHFTL